jgi:singapore isolate B (sub-type 7) whole genome shotgun sequence assembly, scaffold_0
MILNEMKTSSDMETRSATDARGYAESISIIQSSMNRAPELVIEEDEMDEDGDEDDPIDDDLDI